MFNCKKLIVVRLQNFVSCLIKYIKILTGEKGLMENTSLSLFGENEFNKDVLSLFYGGRTLVLDDEITPDILQDIVIHILQWNKDDKDIPCDKREKIKLLIDSDGGSAISAINLIDVIENSKTPVIGIAFSVAASAASSILIACKERYGFKHSVVLIHDGSVFVGNSGNKAKQTMAFLDRVDEINKELILARTKITEEEFEANKEKEQYMFANEAKEKGIIDGIIGIDIDLDDIL